MHYPFQVGATIDEVEVDRRQVGVPALGLDSERLGPQFLDARENVWPPFEHAHVAVFAGVAGHDPGRDLGLPSGAGLSVQFLTTILESGHDTYVNLLAA